jgi:hypothetical protein
MTGELHEGRVTRHRAFVLARLYGGVAAMALLLHATPASAQDTYISMTSDPDDYIGLGMSQYFTPDTAAISSRSEQGNRVVRIAAFPFAGGWWYVDFAAPSGEQLVPGAYEGATRWPFSPPTAPGLSVSGDGRGCNTLTGRFDVIDAHYGPHGYVERFHATFEQHCEGGAPALHGEVFIANPPPPPILQITLTVLERGEVDRVTGAATVRGTVACTAPTYGYLSGTMTQRANRYMVAQGSFNQMMQCSPKPVAWSGRVTSWNGVPFNPGTIKLELTAFAPDPNYPAWATEQVIAGVNLVRASR